MKLSYMATAVAITTLGAVSSATAAAPGDAYDPLALDHFIAQALETDAVLSNGADVQFLSGVSLLSTTAPVVRSAQVQRLDSDDAATGPGTKIIKPKLKLRWRVGVFR